MVVVQGKELLRVSRSAAETRSMISDSVLLPSDTKVAMAMVGAQKQYALTTKNNPGHNLGPSYYMSAKALLMCAVSEETLPQDLKTIFTEELKLLTTEAAFRDRVRMCTCADTYDSSQKRIELAFGMAWRTYTLMVKSSTCSRW